MSSYGRYDLEYIRTDRNGTKIYHDNNCPRCAGYGQSDNWAMTGKICYSCGGTGLRNKPRVVKVYTQEHEAKLESARLERERIRLEKNPPPSKEELEKAALEARRNTWESEGLSRDGKGYAYFGDTFRIKEKIKRAGGKWNRFLTGWVAPASPNEIGIEIAGGVQCREINAENFTNSYGYLDIDKMTEINGR